MFRPFVSKAYAGRARLLSALLLVASTFPSFIPMPALATDNCTASIYSTSDSVTGSSAASSQAAIEVGVKFTPG